jgi:AcrR family transcriptional regulator
VSLVRSTKEEIVLAAERLIGDHGVDGVSLRQIAAASDNGNNSAVQYHFGTKSDLVRAVFEYRLPPLRQRRSLLISERRPSDLRGWLECQVRAVLEQSELDDSHYMAFVASLFQHRDLAAFGQQPEEYVESHLEFDRSLRAHLGHLDEPVRTRRLDQAMSLIVFTAADRERARALGHAVLPFSVELANLLDGVVGFLRAPASKASRVPEAEGAAAEAQRWPALL